MPDFKKITHVIYDLDGLLLDTEPIYDRVYQAIAHRCGKTLSESVKSQISGRNALDSARTIIEMLDLPLTPESFLREREPLLRDLLPDAKPLPGAVRLTQHLHQHRIRQAVATSSAGLSFELKTSNHTEWLALFDCIVKGNDPAIALGKPAPDIFLITAQRLDADPAECLVFEDALAGLKAAIGAGMSVVAVPDASMDKQLYHNAHQVLNSLREFQPQLWQLPAFD